MSQGEAKIVSNRGQLNTELSAALAAACPRRGRDIMLKRAISPEMQAQLTERFGRVVRYRANAGEHFHPTLAVERELALEFILDYVGKVSPSYQAGVPVLDYFGNERAMARLELNHHSIMPQLVASDAVRWSNADRGRACQHLPLQCDCVQGSVGVFVQSVQYASPQDVAILLDRTQDKWGLAVVHRYTGISGSFYATQGGKSEMAWYRSSSHVVHATMDGGMVSWEHDACDWLDKLHPVGGGACLQSQSIWTNGVTHVYLLSLTRNQPPPPVMREWNAATYSTTAEEVLYALPSTFNGRMNVALNTTEYKLENTKILRFGGVLVLYAYTSLEVLVSEAIVNTLVSRLLTNVLDAAMFRQAVRWAYQLYAAAPNLPSSHLPRTVLASVLLAFQDTAQLTTGVLVNYLDDNLAMFSVNNALVAFNPPRSVNVTTIAGCLLSGATSYTVATLYPTTISVAPAVTSSLVAHSAPLVMAVALPVVSVSVPPVALLWGAVSTVTTIVAVWQWAGVRSHDTKRCERIRATEASTNHVTLPWEVVTHDITPVFKATQSFAAKPAVMAEGTLVTVREPELTRDPVAALTLRGVGFQVKPTYYNGGSAELESAVTNRLAIPTPAADPEQVKAAEGLYAQTPLQAAYMRRTKKFALSRNLVEQWATARYPKARVKELIKAYEEYERDGFTKDDRSYDMFVKKEKQVALAFFDQWDIYQEHAVKAPRIILAMSDKVLVTTGPLFDAMAQARSELWSTVQWPGMAPAVAPRHCSAEALGKWHSQVIEEVGEDALLAFDDDGTKWDAHTKEHAVAMEIRLLVAPFRLTDPALKNFVLHPSKVRASAGKHGVKFSGGIQRATGESKTDIGNTTINEAKTVYILERGSGKDVTQMHPRIGIDYWIAACGDDGFGLVRKSFLFEQFGTEDLVRIKEIWHESGLRLGYDLTLNIGPVGDREFCSRWFYPVAGGYLPGGKIGRVLSRAGYFIDHKHEQTLKSATLGALRDNYHVPFLREYFERVLELLPKKSKLGGREEAHSLHCAERHEYDSSTLAFVERKYGLTREDLARFKQLLAGATSLPVTIDWPPLAGALIVDSA